MSRDKIEHAHFEFGRGLQENLDPLLVRPPYLLTAENLRMQKAGRIGKRLGMPLLGTTGLSGTPHTVFTHEQELIAISEGSDLRRYSSNRDQWAAQSPHPVASATGNESHPLLPCDVSIDPVYRDEEVERMDSTGTVDGLIIEVFTVVDDIDGVTTRRLYGHVIDGTTLETVTPPTQLIPSAGTLDVGRALVAKLGSGLFLVLSTSSAAGIIYWTYNTSTKAWTSTTSATLVAGAIVSLAMSEDTFASVVHIAYSTSAPDTVIIEVNTSVAINRTLTLAGVAAAGRLAIHRSTFAGDLMFVALAVSAASDLLVRRVDVVTYTVTSGPWTAFAALSNWANLSLIAINSSGELWVAGSSVKTASVTSHTRFRRFSSSGTAQSRLIFTAGSIVSEWFLRSARPFIGLVRMNFNFGTSANQSIGLLLSPYNDGVDTRGEMGAVARFLVDRGAEITSESQQPCRVAPRRESFISPGNTSSKHRFLCRSLRFDSASTTYGAKGVSFELPGRPLRKEGIDRTSYVSGGQLWAYDGLNVTEAGPHIAAEVVSSQVNGGGSMIPGVYSYVAIVEWEDRFGALHRSAPQPVPLEVTVTQSTRKVLLAVVQLTPRARDGASHEDVRYKVYRTENGGSTFYLAATSDAPHTAGTLVTGTVDVEDDTTDATLIEREVLYTTGNVLGDEPVPGAADIFVAKNRLFVLSSDDRKEWWYSKSFEPGYAPGFNPVLKLRTDEEGVCGATMDDQVFLFSQDSIFVVTGEGLDDTGSVGSFSQPFRLASSVGCIDRNSLVVTPQGIVFRSRRGLELLDRSLQVQPLDAMEDTLSTNTITSAVLVPKENEVRFSMKGSTGSQTVSATVLVWNFKYDAWWKDLEPKSPLHACLWQRRYTMVSFDSSTYQVSAEGTTHVDGASTHIAERFRTGWVVLVAPLMLTRPMRVQVLGERKAAHGLTAKLYYNYVDSAVDTFTWTESEIGALTPYHFELTPSNELCVAFSLEISDSAPAGGANQGFEVTMIGVEFQGEPMLQQLPFTARK